MQNVLKLLHEYVSVTKVTGLTDRDHTSWQRCSSH